MASKKKKRSPQDIRRMQLLKEVLADRLPPDQAERAVQFMWKTWGSLGNIVSAPEENLAAVPGMTPDAAHSLRLTLELARACLEEQTDDVRRVTDTKTAVELLRPLYLGKRAEAVAAILLDSGNRVIYRGIVNEGTVSSVPLYMRTLVRLCIDYDAESLVMAHNHISGSALPSSQDVLTTKQVEMALDTIQVSLRDHVILTDETEFSFFSSGILESITAKALKERREELKDVLDMVSQTEQTGWDLEE